MLTNTNFWVDYIGDQSTPLFQSAVDALLGVVKDDEITCKQLADSIVRDPLLTMRILKIANSSFAIITMSMRAISVALFFLLVLIRSIKFV